MDKLIRGPIMDQWEAQAQHNIKQDGFQTRYSYLLQLQMQLSELTEITVDANENGNVSLPDEVDIVAEIDKLAAKCVEMRAYMTHPDAMQHETIVANNVNIAESE